MASFLQHRIVEPLMAMLRQGTTPRKLSCSLACGVVCGLFPVLGTTTMVSAGVALAFGLNLPAVQLVNYLIYPLQLAGKFNPKARATPALTIVVVPRTGNSPQTTPQAKELQESFRGVVPWRSIAMSGSTMRC